MKKSLFIAAFTVCGWVVPACVIAAPAPVKEVLEQGGFYIGRVNAGDKVYLNKKPVFVGKDGYFGIGFDRLAGKSQTLKICTVDKACTEQVLSLKKRDYVVQQVRGVSNKHVNPDPEQTKRVEADNAAVVAVRKRVNDGADFRLGFKLPIDAQTSGVYGSRRLYNGEERSWHKGHDLAAPVGTPVKAPAGGVVRMTRDTFMAGNLLVLDHGLGFYTVYAHLNKFKVKVGQRVEQGDVIAEVGTTGRSTGPHLHWGMYWQNVAIDPILWVTGK